MGADLYIEPIFKENKEKYEDLFNKAVAERDKFNVLGKKEEAEKAQKEVSEYYDKMYSVGYFRDSYNGTSLLWKLGLSWWECGYIKRGYISIANAKKLLKQVQSTELEPITRHSLEEGHCKVDDGECSVESWKKYFVEKKKLFEEFLKTAINLKAKIRASV